MSMKLDSPMEALAINYLNQLHGGCGWAWIAFLTAAAISFWKIKLSLQLVNSPCLSSHKPQTCSPVDDIDHQQEPEDEELKTASVTYSSFNSKSSSSCISSSNSRYISFCSMENRKSCKFSMYYYNDENDNNTSNRLTRYNNNLYPEEEKEEEEEEEITVSRGPMNCFKQQKEAAARWKWEPMLLKMKTTEMVWYRYQDLTLLNGNVVRLWN